MIVLEPFLYKNIQPKIFAEFYLNRKWSLFVPHFISTLWSTSKIGSNCTKAAEQLCGDGLLWIDGFLGNPGTHLINLEWMKNRVNFGASKVSIRYHLKYHLFIPKKNPTKICLLQNKCLFSLILQWTASDNQTLIWFTIGPIYILRISLEGKLIEVDNIHKIPVSKHLFKVKKRQMLLWPSFLDFLLYYF